MKEPSEDCPRYLSCSVNACPLDTHYSKLYSAPLDSERKCTFAKSRRLRIAEDYPGALELGGLTRKEAAGNKVWEERDPAERADFVAKATQRLESLPS